MSSTRRGNALEAKAISILTRHFGYMLWAKAKRTPIYVNRPGVNSARFVVGGGGSDLVDGSTDAILGKREGPAAILLLQVTTTNGASARRQKLRFVLPRLPTHLLTVMLWAWDDKENAFRVFRMEDDFLERGWRIDAKTDGVWPWDKPEKTTKQVSLT